jgi:hypothetical protein
MELNACVFLNNGYNIKQAMRPDWPFSSLNFVLKRQFNKATTHIPLIYGKLPIWVLASCVTICDKQQVSNP